ncbi:MAG TPA: hypothetical protein ACFCUC_11865 [Desulfobacterales bacterium]
MNTILILNARLVNEGRIQDGDLLVAKGISKRSVATCPAGTRISSSMPPAKPCCPA